MSKALTIAVFDDCTGSKSCKLLWQEVAKVSFGCLLDDQSARQWVWYVLVDGQKSIQACGPWVRLLEVPCLHCAAPVTMFPKWLTSHWVVLVMEGSKATYHESRD